MAFYGTTGGLSTYASATGRTVSGDANVALTVASSWLDGAYGPLFPGIRAGGYDQALEWPRRDAVTRDGFAIPTDAVPDAVVNATYEAALRQAANPGSLAPDRGRDEVVTAIKAGSVEIHYADPAKLASADLAGPIYPVIDGILARLLTPRIPAVFAV